MRVIILFSALVATATAVNFTIINGQIFTPGLAIVDAPQPFTPLGGGFLQVAIDISGDGKLPQFQDASVSSNSPTGFYNVTMFLSSYVTGLNLTISNGTATVGNGSLGEILAQESGSTVKHVNWNWPACLVGNGKPSSSNSDRGDYNISIRQNFKLNNTNFYTIFDLPISVTNSITAQSSRVACDTINNDLIPWNTLNQTANYIAPARYPFTNGNGVQVDVSPASTSSRPNGLGTTETSSPTNGLGPTGTGSPTNNGLGPTDTSSSPNGLVPPGTASPINAPGTTSASIATKGPGNTVTNSASIATRGPENTVTNSATNGLGTARPDAVPGNGLGSTASLMSMPRLRTVMGGVLVLSVIIIIS